MSHRLHHNGPTGGVLQRSVTTDERLKERKLERRSTTTTKVLVVPRQKNHGEDTSLASLSAVYSISFNLNSPIIIASRRNTPVETTFELNLDTRTKQCVKRSGMTLGRLYNVNEKTRGIHFE